MNAAVHVCQMSSRSYSYVPPPPSAGYNGNLFETSKGPKGGDFDKAKDPYRFVVGSGNIIPGLDEGIKGMQAGGVRQIVVPPEVCDWPQLCWCSRGCACGYILLAFAGTVAGSSCVIATVLWCLLE